MDACRLRHVVFTEGGLQTRRFQNAGCVAATGGVSASGGRGLAGRGAGRTSIGGGNGGGTCWLTG
jgi:hypothetical protein